MSENDFFEKYNKSLVEVGARSLYHRMAKIYAEAVTNSTPLKPDSLLAKTFNTGLLKAKLTSEDKTKTEILGHQVDSPLFPDYLDSFLELINLEYSVLAATGRPSHEFLKDQYAIYEVPEPPDGFFDINHGVTNWWEKTIQYKNGFFSKVFALQTDLKKKELILNSGFKVKPADFPINYETLITSSAKKYKDLRAELISDTVVSFVSHGLFEGNLGTGFDRLTFDQKMAVIESKPIKDNYFLFLQPGFKLKPNPDNKSATLFIRVFFDVYGASVASSLTDITGFTEPPKVPRGVRKSFSVKNFQKGLDSVKKYIKQVKKSKKNKGLLPLDVPELLLKNSKTLKDIFKKIVKDNGLGSHSTVTFVFDGDEDSLHAELRFLTLVDGNNITLKSEELKTLLNTDAGLNNAIGVLNYINCFIGGNAEEEEEEEDDSSPFSLAPPRATQEERAAAHKKQKSKTKFTGDPTLKNSLKSLEHSGGKTITTAYDQFYNRVDLAGVTSFAKQDLASIVPEDQVKKIKFQAYIESLDVNEIIDCVLTSVKDTPFHDPLQAAIYAPLSFFYNAAKISDPETFNFPDKDTNLPTGDYITLIDPQAESKFIPEHFPYVTMIPEEQRVKIFSTIVNNDPQYRNNPQLKKVGFTEISKRSDFSAEDFITLAIGRSVMKFTDTLPLTAPVEEKKEEEPKPKKPKSPEELAYDAAKAKVKELRTTSNLLYQEFRKHLGKPDSDPEKKAADLAHEKAYDEWIAAIDAQDVAADKYFKTLPKVDQESKKTKLDFDHLFTLVSKNNKKLRDSFKPGKAYSNDDLKVYRSQQKSLKKIYKPPSFGWYNEPAATLSHNGFLSVLINQAKEQAMLAILKGMADAAKSGTDKQINGNPDTLDKLDGSANALIGSNDPLQNVIDSTGNNFNSPQDAMSAIGASLFPNASAAEIKCFFTGFASEVNFFTQAKLFKNPSNTNDPDFEIVRGILERCGLPHTDNIVIGILVKLGQLIDQDLLELKLKEMKEAMLEYLDVCEDPNANYIENLRRFLDDQSARDQANGESASAAQKLLDLLSMLDENKIKNLGPQLYCKQGYTGPVVFDNQYTEITLDSQDGLVTSILKDVNEDFDNDIGKFKPTILNQSFDNPLAKMGLGGLTDDGNDMEKLGNFGKFLKGNLGKSDKKSYTVIEDLLTNIINKKLLFSSSGFSEVQDKTEEDLKYYKLKFGQNDEVYYYIFLNKGAAIKDWKLAVYEYIPLDFEEKSISTLMVDTAPFHAGGSPKIIIEHKKITDYVDTEKEVYDLLFNAGKYDALGESDTNQGGSGGMTLNSFWLTLLGLSDEQPNAYGIDIGASYGAMNILAKLYGTILGQSSDVTTPTSPLDLESALATISLVSGDTSTFVRSIFQNVFSGVVSRLVDSLALFDDAVFSKIPFKATAAKTIFSEEDGSKKFYTDGGLISTPEIFEDFKTMRNNVQCYIEKGSSPDSFQIAKLSSLYQTLFNTVIVQQMLNFYFSLSLSSEKYGFVDPSLGATENKKIIFANVQNAFNNTLINVNNLSVNYKRDLQQIYKYQQILDGDKPKTGDDAPSDNDIITYYVDKYYETILAKLQKRMHLGITTKQKNDTPSSAQVKDSLGLSKSYPIYSQNAFPTLHKLQASEDGAYNYGDSPVYLFDTNVNGKLHNGFLIQDYVDIRQNFNNLSTNYLVKTWAGGKVGSPDFPGQPEAKLSNADAGSSDFTLNPNDIYQQYKDNYLRTQGKISFEDFKKYYSDPANSASTNDLKDAFAGATIGNFFDKVAVGQRLCLVLDYSDPIAKNLFNVISNDVFRYNNNPKLSAHQYYEQMRILFDEKVFLYGESKGGWVDRLKIVIPIIEFEKDVLRGGTGYKYKPLTSLPALYKAVISEYGGIANLGAGGLNQLLDTNLLRGALSPALFDDLTMTALGDALISTYGEKLTTIFNPTIKEILSQIAVANSSINKDWKTDPDVTDDDGLDYAPLIAAMLPIAIQGLATFTDPAWRTPWFWPGPATPLGFLAKILKPF